MQRAISVLLVFGLVACGAQPPTDEAAPPANTNQKSVVRRDGIPIRSVSPNDTSPPDAWTYIGDTANVIGIVSGVASMLQFFGISLDPTNQQILTELNTIIQNENTIISDENAIINSLAQEVTQINGVSLQNVEIALADLVGESNSAQVDIVYYLNNPTNSQAQNWLNDAWNDSLTPVQTLLVGETPPGSGYWTALTANGLVWNPLAATIPLMNALQVRFGVLSAYFPGGFWTNSAAHSELCSYYTFFTQLAANTKAWADSQCSIKVNYVCGEQVCNNELKPPCRCIYYNDVYNVNCAPAPYQAQTTVFTATGCVGSVCGGKETAAQAGAAANASLASNQQAIEADLGVPQEQTVAANLLSNLKSCP